MQTSQKAKPQRSSSRGGGGSGRNIAARVKMTIAPARVETERRNMVQTQSGRPPSMSWFTATPSRFPSRRFPPCSPPPSRIVTHDVTA